VKDRPRFLASEQPNIDPGKALFHVIPAPLERSVSYGGGTSRGPEAILEASNYLELWDGRSVPADSGIYTLPAVDCRPGTEAALEGIRTAAEAALGAGAVPALLGGEHTVTLGALRAVAAVFGAEKVGIVQFDAHGDLRDSYHGDPLSHACVMRRGLDLGFKLFQAGMRSLSEEDLLCRKKYGIPYIDAPEAAGWGGSQKDPSLAGMPLSALPLPENFPPLVYLTFDVDGLDPSIIPATGTPEPGGLGWYQALGMIESVAASGRKIIGFDVVELAPDAASRASEFAAARLVYNIMGIIARGSGS
jgi:agmatinase